MKNKRISAIFAVLLFALSMLLAIGSFAAGAPKMTVESKTGCPGETVEIGVTLENNPGFSAASLKIEYDDTRLELVGACLGADFESGANVSYDNLPYLTFVRSKNSTSSEFLSIVFTVSEEAALGDAFVGISYQKGDISNTAEEDVDFEIVAGKIEVTEERASDTPISDFSYELNGNSITITGYNGTSEKVVIGKKYTVDEAEYTVTAIAGEAFLENTAITSVTIPETVTSVGEAAFYDCTSLTDVTVFSRDCDIGEVAFGYYYVKRNVDGLVEGFVLRGFADSSAANYASSNEIQFSAIPELKIYGRTVTFDALFGVRFLIKGSDFDKFTEYFSADPEIEYVSGGKSYAVGELTDYKDAGTDYKSFMVKGIAARDLDKNISITVSFAGCVFDLFEDSIKDALCDVTKGDYAASFKSAANSMLAYGKAASDYFNGKTSAEPTEEVADIDVNSGGAGDILVNHTSEILPEDKFVIRGTSLLLKDEVSIIFWLQAKEPENIADYDVYINGKKTDLGFVLNSGSAGYYTVTVQLNAAEIIENQTIEIKKDGETVSNTYIDNVASYCATVINENGYPESLKSLCQSIVNYAYYINAYAN